MLHCGACGKFLSPAGAATCGVCPLKYHRACLAISDKAQISKDWVCPSCKKGARRGDNSQTPVKGICEGATNDLGDTESAPSCSVAGAPDSAAAEQLCDSGMQEFRKEFAECILEMREFRKEMELLRESFTSVTARLEGVEHRLEVLEQRRTEEDGGRVAELERTVSELKLELNDRDQEALLSDLEIGHLPEVKGESVPRAVVALAGQLGVALEERDVVFAERVGAPPAEAGGRVRRVVVRLARRHLRDELLRSARVRRAGLVSTAGPRVFLNERLTRLNRQLFHRVREECKRLQWRYSWTRRGRIYARQGDGKPVFQFRSDRDLTRVFGARRTTAQESAD